MNGQIRRLHEGGQMIKLLGEARGDERGPLHSWHIVRNDAPGYKEASPCFCGPVLRHPYIQDGQADYPTVRAWFGLGFVCHKCMEGYTGRKYPEWMGGK